MRSGQSESLASASNVVRLSVLRDAVDSGLRTQGLPGLFTLALKAWRDSASSGVAMATPAAELSCQEAMGPGAQLRAGSRSL